MPGSGSGIFISGAAPVEKGQHADHRRRPDVSHAGQHPAAGLPRGNRRQGRDAHAGLHALPARARRLEGAFDLWGRSVEDRPHQVRPW